LIEAKGENNNTISNLKVSSPSAGPEMGKTIWFAGPEQYLQTALV
jgi:hypothetical protein